MPLRLDALGSFFHYGTLAIIFARHKLPSRETGLGRFNQRQAMA